jgi:hypothetical protein
MASCKGGAPGTENPRAGSGPAWGWRQRNSAGFRMIVVHGWVADPWATRSDKLCVRAALPVACSIGGRPRPRPPHPSLHRDVVAAMAANPRANGGARVPPPCVVAPVGPTRAGGGRYSPVDSLVTACRPGYRRLPPAIFSLSGGAGTEPGQPRPPGSAPAGPGPAAPAIRAGTGPGSRICHARRRATHCRRRRQARRSLRASGFIPSCLPRWRAVSQPYSRRVVQRGRGREPRPARTAGRSGWPKRKT